MTQNGKIPKITLRSARVNAGMTVAEAAEKLGIHPNTLRNWEKDSSNIEYNMAKKIAELYGYPADLIYFGFDTTISCEKQ